MGAAIASVVIVLLFIAFAPHGSIPSADTSAGKAASAAAAQSSVGSPLSRMRLHTLAYNSRSANSSSGAAAWSPAAAEWMPRLQARPAQQALEERWGATPELRPQPGPLGMKIPRILHHSEKPLLKCWRGKDRSALLGLAGLTATLTVSCLPCILPPANQPSSLLPHWPLHYTLQSISRTSPHSWPPWPRAGRRSRCRSRAW